MTMTEKILISLIVLGIAIAAFRFFVYWAIENDLFEDDDDDD